MPTKGRMLLRLNCLKPSVSETVSGDRMKHLRSRSFVREDRQNPQGILKTTISLLHLPFQTSVTLELRCVRSLSLSTFSNAPGTQTRSEPEGETVSFVT